MSIDPKSVREKVKNSANHRKMSENMPVHKYDRPNTSQLYQSIHIYYERWRKVSHTASQSEIIKLAKELEEFCNLSSFKSLPFKMKKSFRELSYTVNFIADPTQFWLNFIKTNAVQFQSRMGCSVCKTVSNRGIAHKKNLGHKKDKVHVNGQTKKAEEIKAVADTRTASGSMIAEKQKIAIATETIVEVKIAVEYKAPSKSPPLQPVIPHNSANGILCFTPPKPKPVDNPLPGASDVLPPSFELSELSGSKPPLQNDSHNGNFVHFSSPVTSEKYVRLKQQNKELSHRMQQLIADITEKDLVLQLEIQKRDKLKAEFLHAREKLETTDKKLRAEIEKAQEERLKISNLLVTKAELELANHKMLLQSIQDQKAKEQLRSELYALQKELASKRSPIKSLMSSPSGNRPPFR